MNRIAPSTAVVLTDLNLSIIGKGGAKRLFHT